ncbi:ClpXP protease specificity-enhancing factor [uncultured Pseudoteredinibacter sp.]|uniref:ClpXP protease specificity-enhancing factor n=1 Tax=uncultured Pseudoteredinibacter sp. TaxID=1641701 RepID=UPI002634ED09|nr:ClpXP protease specificity-enhancing factor [uncultured Pseudoteredinibacter sp.]
MSMSSSRPYMVRALYEWIVDNECTPHVLVSAYTEGTEVPQQYVNEDGLVVLNISPTAVSGLAMDNEALSFGARFGGVPTDIFVPYSAVLRIYARENGQGLVFEPEVDPSPEPPKPSKPEDSGVKRPSLKVVK